MGRDLYLGDEVIRWDESIKALYYTSAGVMIRSGESSDTNEGASQYALVTPTGERSAVHVTMGDRIRASSRTAPGSPTPTRTTAGSRWWCTTSSPTGARPDHRARPPRGVRLGGSAGRDRRRPGVGEQRPGLDPRRLATGELQEVPETDDTSEIQNGSYAIQRGNVWEIRSMADDSTVGEVTMLKGWYAFFSPDGRLMNSFPNDVTEVRDTWPAYVHDVASGTSFEYPDGGDDIGWTPDGHLSSRR